MARAIYLNLPVNDLVGARSFYGALGFAVVEEFSNEDAVAMAVGERIHVMLLRKPFFASFTSKEVCDATRSTEVLIGLQCESREEVDELVRKAVEAGGTVPREPQDHGFMYGHAFEDLDGHVWEPFTMEPSSTA